MVYVDGHVHLYPTVSVDDFLRLARANLRASAENDLVSPTGFVLCMTDGPERGYERIREWSARPHDDLKARLTDGAVVIQHNEDPAPLVVIPGKQIRTRNRLEVLAIGTTDYVQDGQSLEESIEFVLELGALPVLPWGVGKWAGRRFRTIERLIGQPDAPSFFVADNGNRPLLWRSSSLIARGISRGAWNLPGSDTLPVPGSGGTAGRYGFVLTARLDLEQPRYSLLTTIRQLSSQPGVFGHGRRLVPFLRDQALLRLYRPAQA